MAIIKKTIATVGGDGGGDRKPYTHQAGTANWSNHWKQYEGISET